MQTMHPRGKKGVRIDRRKYDITRQAILACLSEGDRTQNELVDCVERRLEGLFEGSKKWYMESVKLDLEARGEVERYPSKPHERYRRR